MRWEILGSGGAVTTPRPLCDCALCRAARAGGKDHRLGPAVYLHDAGILFDTPEEIAEELARSGVTALSACFYSHWHPDHTAGRRIFEANMDYGRGAKALGVSRRTEVYAPDFVRAPMERRMDQWNQLERFQSMGLIGLHTLSPGQSAQVGDVRVTPVQLAESYVAAYIVEADGKRALVAMDELFGWQPDLQGRFDLVMLPVGYFARDPETGLQRWNPSNPICQGEADFEESCRILERIDHDRAVFLHVEEIDGLDHDTLCRYVALAAQGRDWSVAYDGMTVEV
jgi:phosphoribosyl 1,2-cyclic phosphate phosphodiesterase